MLLLILHINLVVNNTNVNHKKKTDSFNSQLGYKLIEIFIKSRCKDKVLDILRQRYKYSSGDTITSVTHLFSSFINITYGRISKEG